MSEQRTLFSVVPKLVEVLGAWPGLIPSWNCLFDLRKIHPCGKDRRREQRKLKRKLHSNLKLDLLLVTMLRFNAIRHHVLYYGAC